MTPKQQAILANLQAVKRCGVNLSNVNQAISIIVDALSYLVENTPEAKQ